MALDGLMINAVRAELSEALVSARVEKIYQPTREELVIAFRGTKGNFRLLISAKGQGARANLTSLAVENPKQPPMFCMLLRKSLGSARLKEIRQHGYDRVLFFDFDAVNELGDPTVITLVAELMGRHSNIILIGGDRKIIEAVKRVGADKSSVRQILPGLYYETPPLQDKLNISEGGKACTEAILSSPKDIELHKLIQQTIDGVSPLLARELADITLKGCDGIRSSLNEEDKIALAETLTDLEMKVKTTYAYPVMLLDENDIPKEFSFIPIKQYREALKEKVYPTLSALLDGYYGELDAKDRMKQKMSDFLRTLTSRIERIERKLAAQRQEILDCKNREEVKIKGDLLSSSLHVMEKGMGSIKLVNYYDPDGAEMEIVLDTRLTPVQNAQKYYKEYRKADTAEKMLKSLIVDGENELTYLDSVYDLTMRATSEAELFAIRAELSEGGYIRSSNRKGVKPMAITPHKYLSSDGFVILSGRNNLQNDKLTLKDSKKEDIWFHTQKIPGSHTVIVADGREIPDSTLTEAATIAATNSKAKNSAQVPVDYTKIKNVKKQPGAKPGMVIYDNFKTAFVDPSEAVAESLRSK